MAEVKIEMRQAYCQTLQAIASQDDKLVVLESDLMKASGTMPFKKQFPLRGIDCGIAESNMVGIASGLSMMGFIPFAATFGCFASRRVFDQFFLSSNYARLNVKLVGTDPGVSAVYNGGTHMPFEDIGLMKTIPDLVIIEPSDATSVAALTRLAYEHQGCVYMRLHRKAVPDIYPSDEKFELGRSKLLRKGSDVTLIGLGAVMMGEVLKASQMLEEEGISASVIDALSVKPLDSRLIGEEISRTKAVVTCENSQVDEGLGSSLANLICDSGLDCRLGKIGIQDRFGQVGTLDYLKKEYGLTASDIVKKAKSVIE